MYECVSENCTFISNTIRGLHDHMKDVHNIINGKMMVKSTENDWTDVMEGHPILPVQR